MNKEIYFWILFLVIIAAGALYLRYGYKPSIEVSVAINGSAIHGIYPYQSLTLPIQIANTGGSEVKDMGIAILIDGNQSSYYTVTLPAGKSTSFEYNFSAVAPGTYNVSAIADPGKVYNIADRKSTTSSVSIDVIANESANPFAYMPGRNVAAEASIYSNLFGFEVMTYLKAYYNITMPEFLGRDIGFLQPLLNFTYQYIHNMSIGYYGFSNGSSAYMLMLRGYLSPSIVGVAAEAENLSTYNTSALGTTVTHVKLGRNATLCSWYSGGWLNNLLYSGSTDCMNVIANRYNSTFTNPYSNISEGLFGGANVSNDLSYTYLAGNAFLVSGVGRVGPTIYIPTVKRSNATSGICFGLINSINGTDFCSEILVNATGGTGKNVSAMRTTELTSKYNATLITIFNTSALYATEATAIGIVKDMHLSGSPVSFVSGINNSCGFANSFGCSNASFANGKLNFTITNLLGSPANVSNIMCYYVNKGNASHIGVQLAPGESKMVSTVCYNGTSQISGFPLGLNLDLIANFTVNGTRNLVAGSAYIPLGQ